MIAGNFGRGASTHTGCCASSIPCRAFRKPLPTGTAFRGNACHPWNAEGTLWRDGPTGDERVAVIGRSTSTAAAAPVRARSLSAALATGAGVGLLGGLIGLSGAEFRLPLLIGLFGFAALQAVIMNKALSLIVVVTALPARLVVVPFDTLNGYWFVVVNLLAGSLIGAWIGATWATRMRSATLYRVLAVLLVLIAVALAWNNFGDLNPLELHPLPRTLLGLAAGVGIGIVAVLMGVAGGELLIPTIVLLFAVDIKIAGSLALAISLPTMLVAFARYSRDRSFEVLRASKGFVLAMAAGSIIGTVLGGLLLGAVPEGVLIPLLVALLLASAIKVWLPQLTRSVSGTWPWSVLQGLT